MAYAGTPGASTVLQGGRRPHPHAGRRPAGHHDLLAAARSPRRTRGRPPHRARRSPGSGCPSRCWRRWRSRSRWSWSSSWHMVIGEMVPKNIAIAGPERTALWLVPPFVAFTAVMRAADQPVQPRGQRGAAAGRVQPRDELGDRGDVRPARRPDRRVPPRRPARRRRLAAAHPHLVLGGAHRRRRAGDAGRAGVAAAAARRRRRRAGRRRHRLLAVPRRARSSASPATCTSRTSSTSRTTPPPKCRPSGSGGCRRSG